MGGNLNKNEPKGSFLLVGNGGLNEVIKKTGDSERADAAFDRSDGSEIGALANFVGKVAFKNAIFGSSASIDKNGARFYHRTSNQPRGARGCDDYIILVKLCQVVAAVEELNIVA